MRISLILNPRETLDEIILPLDFRRHFISFVKTVLSDSRVFTRFELKRPGYSPYVFTVNFRKIVDIDKKKQEMRVKSPVYVLFSTGVYEVFTAFCNGAISLKGKEIVLGLEVQGINLLPLKKINTSPQNFKILGHVVLRGKSGYLAADTITKEEIEEAINEHLFKQYEFIQREYGGCPIYDLEEIEVLTEQSNFYKGVCHHYGGWLTTLQGNIVINGSPDSMQFLYDFGLGVRNGQGFGFLEV
ncbi:MAG: hypothetical protein GX088_05785 [Clostridia bacterium]|nr:hypothetical protein [Clostridia bacterium]